MTSPRVGPVLILDDDPLVRHAACDGSVRPGALLPRDVERSPAMIPWLPPNCVFCMETAWRMHRGEVPRLPVDLVGDTRGRTRPGVLRHRLALADDDVVVRGGMALTSAARTLTDLARLAPLDVAAQAALDAREMMTHGAWRDAIDAQAGYAGIARARLLSAAINW